MYVRLDSIIVFERKRKQIERVRVERKRDSEEEERKLKKERKRGKEKDKGRYRCREGGREEVEEERQKTVIRVILFYIRIYNFIDRA